MATSEIIQQQVSLLQAAHVDMARVTTDVITAIGQKDEQAAYALLKVPFRDANKSFNEAATTILTIVKERFIDSSANKNEDVGQTTIMLALISLCSVMLLIALLYVIHRFFSKPLVQLTNAATQIAAGDLRTKPIHIQSKDELGQLASAFNDMKQAITQLITLCQENAIDLCAIAEELNANTNTVANSATHVTEHAEEIARHTSYVAKSAQQTVHAMHASEQAIQTIATATKSIYTDTEETNIFAKQGANTLQRATTDIAAIHQSVTYAKTGTQTLEETTANFNHIQQAFRHMTNRPTNITVTTTQISSTTLT